MTFSDSTNKSGIVEKIDDLLGTTAESYPLTKKVRDVNLGLDRVLSLIFRAGGKWAFDDSNFDSFPIITGNLVQGQRDYSFTEDTEGNLILDIAKVYIKDEEGIYHELSPFDPRNDGGETSFEDGLDVEDTPSCYQKLGNAIRFNVEPSYSATDGIKMYVSREGSYFSTTDTTKTPGFAGLFHVYLAYFAAAEYATAKNMTILPNLESKKAGMEKDITSYYGSRERDTKAVLKGRITPHR
jgi:hypothetical protein